MNVVLHCKPSMLTTIKKLNLDWCYSKQGFDEIDVIVEDHLDLEDDELVESIGLDYEQINCIELAD